jgi:transcriptional regulator with XRE-family HTH domain
MGDRQADVARRHAAARSGEELLFNRGLGLNLRERRRAADLTQDQLAAFAGMTRGSIANIERGEQMPGLYRLVLICKAIGCDVHDVMPDEVFSAETVAGAVSAQFLSDVQRVQRRAVELQSQARPR